MDFIFWMDSPGSWVRDGFENGQVRGRMIIKESNVTVQNKTLKPRKEQKWEGAGELGIVCCLDRGDKDVSRVPGSSLWEVGGTSC